MGKLLITLLVVSVLIVGCSKKEVKKVSEDSMLATEAFSVAESLRQAYINRDTRAMEQVTTKDGYRAMLSSLKAFDTVDLTFTPALVDIEEAAVYMNVSWRGKWQKGQKTTEERGMAVFILKGRPFKLDGIIRGNPFIYPD
jgi:hypothetical protein